MPDRVSPSSFQSTLDTFRSYLADVEGSMSTELGPTQKAFQDHSTKLRLFINFCQKDDVLRWLAERLQRRIPVDDVVERAMAETLALPREPLDRDAFIYSVMVLLKQKHRLDVRELLSRAFQGATIEDRWRDFRRRMVGTFSADMRALCDLALDLTKEETSIDPDDAFGRALARLSSVVAPTPSASTPAAPAPAPAAPAPAPAVATSAAPAAPAAPRAASLAGAVTWPAILKAAAALGPEDSREDLRIDAELLELELAKSKPNAARVDELVASFEAAGEALGAIAREAAGRARAAKPAKKKTVKKKS